ncbi:unnamed protein product [Adineta steineri]|uniref:Uncharacterized protein n=2 Tax=Adineta steineri TaxID=433720 RepID=A0A814CAS2_9BILA|nr:unnamed protein product [Adineta steineri]
MYYRDCQNELFYYESIQVKVNKSGYYSFRGSGDIDPYGSIYKNKFNPLDPSENLFDQDYARYSNIQFKFDILLNVDMIYVLVVTTFDSKETGKFLIVVLSENKVILERLSTPVNIQLMYSSKLTDNSPTYYRDCQVPQCHYETLQIHVNTTGLYVLWSENNIKAYGYIYKNDFNPLKPSENLLLSHEGPKQSSCVIGDQCNFYIKGIGLTLDDILRDELQPKTALNNQSFSIKLSAGLAIIMFIAGLINSILSLITFQSKDSQQVGCGMYLVASSITSLLTIIMFIIQFWFVVLTHINVYTSVSVLRGGCVSIEPILKLFLYLDGWLNACVAVERAVLIFKGVNFDKKKSKSIARRTILILPFCIFGTLIHENQLIKIKEELNNPPKTSIEQDYQPFINEISSIPSGKKPIFNKWKQNAITVAGGNGKAQELSQLNSPRGIFIDEKKNIFIADHDNHHIVKWKCNAKEGQIIAGEIKEGNRMNQLNRPTDVIVDQQNHSIIIADKGNRRVIQWVNQTQQILIDNIHCHGLAIDKYGFLYVSDWKKNKVRRWKMGEYNNEGTIVAGGNERGNQLSQLNSPGFIFVDEDQSVYVSDSNNHRVMKWIKDAKEGIVVAGGNGEGGNLNQLSSPAGVTVNDYENQSNQLYGPSELKNEAGPLSSKNLAMNKLQEEYDKQKKSDNELIVRLKQEVEDYRSQFNISKDKPIEIPSQRFQPLFQAKEIAKNTSAIFREPLAKLSNITNEIKDKFAPVVSNIKQKISNIYGNGSNSVVNQNIPAPPLNNNKQQEQQPGRESGAEVDKNNQEQNKIENLQRLKRSLNDTNKSSFNKSNGDQQNSDIHNVAKDLERARNAPYDKANLANNQPDNVPSQLLGNRKNYRVGDREESQRIANKKDGNQVIANNNGQEQALVRGHIL